MWLAAIPLIALIIGGLAIVVGWRMRAHPVPAPAHSRPPHPSEGLTGFLRSPRGRLAVYVPATLLIVALWLAFDLSIAILPAVTLPIWATFFADQQPSEAVQRRLGLTLVAGGLLFLLVVVLATVFLASR